MDYFQAKQGLGERSEIVDGTQPNTYQNKKQRRGATVSAAAIRSMRERITELQGKKG